MIETISPVSMRLKHSTELQPFGNLSSFVEQMKTKITNKYEECTRRHNPSTLISHKIWFDFRKERKSGHRWVIIANFSCKNFCEK